ncbi:MAG: N-acetylmuramoyl-L-alanine amidase, partial [Alicyclobacillus sp.]|nr:N-acetylmuramoyl-L-alanine amidase [Alicyclobacillus sp.]
MRWGRLGWRPAAVAAGACLWALVCTSPPAFAAEPGLVGRCIVLDPGHGGPDGGARGVGGVQEKDVVLPVAQYLASLLRQAGADVYLTRTRDTDLASEQDRLRKRRHQSDLRHRTQFVLSKHPDAFVSIHCNSVPSPVWRGAHTIYMTGNVEGEAFARCMQRQFRQSLLPTAREVDDMATLYLLKRVPGAAVLASGAAVRSGAGMVRYAGPAADAVRAQWPEVVATGSVTDAGRVQSWVVGPGIGTGAQGRSVLEQVLAAGVPVCADA